MQSLRLYSHEKTPTKMNSLLLIFFAAVAMGKSESLKFAALSNEFVIKYNIYKYRAYCYCYTLLKDFLLQILVWALPPILNHKVDLRTLK